jgi:very-short-patch-repair endonuclease
LNGKPELGADRDRAVEIDLVCEPLRIAIEVDGYYHFRDADAYRRDRRKDLMLQKQGFVVIRCLAIDVVTRLEEILADVVAAVAWRRD